MATCVCLFGKIEPLEVPIGDNVIDLLGVLGTNTLPGGTKPPRDERLGVLLGVVI